MQNKKRNFEIYIFANLLGAVLHIIFNKKCTTILIPCCESKLYHRDQCSCKGKTGWPWCVGMRFVESYYMYHCKNKSDLYAAANGNLHINKLVIDRLPVSSLLECKFVVKQFQNKWLLIVPINQVLRNYMYL